jgi:hypothetical protein
MLSAVRASCCFGTPMSLGHASGLGKHVFWVVQRDARQMLAGILVTGVGASPVRLTRVAGQSTKQWAHISPLRSAEFIITLVHPHMLSSSHATVPSFVHHFARHPVVSQRSLLCRHNR